MLELARNLDWVVILLEDEKDQRESICKKLGELTCWNVIGVADGKECLDLVKKRHPSVVILDLALEESELQGADVARQIFRGRKWGWLPIVVMLTRYLAQKSRDEGNPLGDAYIAKEHYLDDPGALVAFIDKIYEARKTGTEASAGPLVYDPKKHGV